jgi:hypothetical protein
MAIEISTFYVLCSFELLSIGFETGIKLHLDEWVEWFILEDVVERFLP